MRFGARTIGTVLAATAVLGMSTVAAPAAQAEGGVTLTTPYPTVGGQPGSSVTFDLDVAADTPTPVELSTSGVPDGWNTVLRGGGFVIHAVTATPQDPAKASLEVDVAQDAQPGTYPIDIVAQGPAGPSTLTLTLAVESQVDAGIELSADFPSLSGDPGNAFTYTLTITNNTPSSQTFTFDPQAPQGWTVTASPTAEARAETVTIDAGKTADVKVTATPPATAEEGEYQIPVTVTAENGATGNVTLTAQVTGTPKMDIGTADQRLDVSGTTGKEERVPLVVSNSGTAPLEDVKLAATAPKGWNVSFDPQQIPSVKPNETVQVTAIVQPATDAVAGDYAMTVRSSAGSESSTVDLRFTLHGSRTLGLVAIGVIVAAVVAVGAVIVRFGRR